MQSQEIDPRQQMILFALMALARPATNRELWDTAGVRVEAKDARILGHGATAYLHSVKRGSVNVHALTEPGWAWCADALPSGRPVGARFPAGVLYAVLNGLGLFLARSERDNLREVFVPDLESWIRAVYAELTVRKRNGDVPVAKVRPWLVGVTQQEVDAELDRMIELPDVFLEAQLNQRLLKEEDHKAAVVIGGEPRHLLRIGAA